MNTTYLQILLTHMSRGYAFLDADFTVRQHNSLFRQFAVISADAEGKNITALYPEAVGLEETLQQIARGNLDYFSLEDVQRNRDDAGPEYFTISLLPGPLPHPLLCLVENVSEKARYRQQIQQQKNEIRLLEGMLRARSDDLTVSILRNSGPIQKVRELIRKISRIPSATILLQGESGVGKSMIARVIHHTSQGKEAPFVEINCAAIPETLLESELFGYEKGAFTNALASKEGLLEIADGGTLFLDEIGEMPLTLQAKLLSFLENKRFRRLGSTRETCVDLRLIAAANRNLAEMVTEGQFREDLFYRLNVVHLELPALRRLGEDILLLAEHFVQSFNVDFKKKVKGISKAGAEQLLGYHWPGNVRELRNVIERAMIFTDGEYIEPEVLQLGAGKPDTKPLSPLDDFQFPPGGYPFEELERKILQAALDQAKGNQSRAAKLLRMSRDTFRYRLEKYGML